MLRQVQSAHVIEQSYLGAMRTGCVDIRINLNNKLTAQMAQLISIKRTFVKQQDSSETALQARGNTSPCCHEVRVQLQQVTYVGMNTL